MTILAFLVAIVVLTIVRGVTIDQFWDWFLINPGAPFYDKLPAISMAQALGLSLMVSVFVYSHTGSDADSQANEGKPAVQQLLETMGKATFIYAFWWTFALILKGWI